MDLETLVREWAEALRSRDELCLGLEERYGMILYGLLNEAEWAQWIAALEHEQAARAAVLGWAAEHPAKEAA